MNKPNEPGVWYEKDGSIVLVWSYAGALWCRAMRGGMVTEPIVPPEGCWKKGDPPDFDEEDLPPRPVVRICYARNVESGDRGWVVACADEDAELAPYTYEWVPVWHPENTNEEWGWFWGGGDE